MQRLSIRHELILLAQAQQAAARNASHAVEARLFWWLPLMRDLAGDELPLAHKFLAWMLGVRRTTVTLIASTLQRAGFIKYRRGHVTIVNVPGLEESSCECHQVVKGHYKLLLEEVGTA